MYGEHILTFPIDTYQGHYPAEELQTRKENAAAPQETSEVPTNYKTYDKDGNWTLAKTVGELAEDFTAALEHGKTLSVTIPRGAIEIARDGEAYRITTLDGKERLFNRNNIKSYLMRQIVRDNIEIVEKKEEYKPLFGNETKVIFSYKNHDVYNKIPDGWKVNEAITTAPRGYVGIDNNKSVFKGERKSGIIRIERVTKYNLKEYKSEHDEKSPLEIADAKDSFVYQNILREGKEPREITSSTYERAQKKLEKQVENVMGLKRRYSLNENPVRIESLKNMPSAENHKELRNWLKAFYKGKPQPVNTDTGWIISVPGTGIEETLNHIDKARGGYRKDLHYLTLPFIDQMLQKAKFNHTEEVPEGKNGDSISVFYVTIDFGNNEIYNARMIVKHFGNVKNYYDHKLTKFEALPIQRLYSEELSPHDNASVNTIHDSGEKSSTKFSRNKQVNPIRKNNSEEYQEYQQKINDYQPEHKSEEQLNREAEIRIAKMGGVENVIDNIVDGDYRFTSDVSQRVAQIL